LNKKAQFYLILTAFIVSAFLVVSSSLVSYKQSTQRNIEVPFSDLPKVTASVETSVRNNFNLALETVQRTGNINYLTNAISNLVSGQYLIQEGELGYFMDNFDLGIYNISDLTILGPSGFEVGLPEARILKTNDLGGGRYSIEAKPGVGNLLVQVHPIEGSPYVYIVDENENNAYDNGEKIIYLTYNYTSSMRVTVDDNTYILGGTARIYADENNEINFRLSNMKQDHIFKLAYPNLTYGTDTYKEGDVIPVKENGVILGLIMVGKIDRGYLDYILLNVQKKISGQEKRKVTFDPYPEKGLKDNEIYCNVYPETVEKGNKVVITSIVHNNLSTEISDEDLACDNRKNTSFEESFTEIEPFGFFISEPFIEKSYEPLTVPGPPSSVLIEMGYSDTAFSLSVINTPRRALRITGYNESIELPEGASAEILGTYIKVLGIDGPDGEGNYTVEMILKNPYLIWPSDFESSNFDIIDYNDLPGLRGVYTVNVQSNKLFFGDLSDVVGKCYQFNDTTYNYKYVDLNGDTEYDYNETIILDSDNSGTYNAGDTVKKGIPPAEGTSLTSFADDMYYVSDVAYVYEEGDVIFKDVGSNGYDTNDLVIPTFQAGDFFVLENYLCFIESYDTDGFFRIVPVYTKGEQENFVPDSYKVFNGFDSNYNLTASKLVEFKYENKGWNFHDVGVVNNVYFNSYSTVYDSSSAVDDGLVYAFFNGDTTAINEKEFYYFKHNISYNIQGFDVKAVISPSDGSHPDQFNIEITGYPGSTPFTISSIREGDTFFIAGQGYKVMGIYIDSGNNNNSSIFFTPVHSYQFNVINNLYKKKIFENDPISSDDLKIQRFTSFLDVYKFYPEKEGTYTFFIRYYYWADLNNDSIIDETEIFIVTEEKKFIVT